MPEPARDDALDALRERVRATQEAAERLVDEATARAKAQRGTPPRGWDAPGATPSDGVADEVRALVGLLDAVRDVLPPELREQVAELVRQLLLVLRALIDWLVDRLDRGPHGAVHEVEDIPIT